VYHFNFALVLRYVIVEMIGRSADCHTFWRGSPCSGKVVQSMNISLIKWFYSCGVSHKWGKIVLDFILGQCRPKYLIFILHGRHLVPASPNTSSMTEPWTNPCRRSSFLQSHFAESKIIGHSTSHLHCDIKSCAADSLMLKNLKGKWHLKKFKLSSGTAETS
jgi:hypothetical protein